MSWGDRQNGVYQQVLTIRLVTSGVGGDLMEEPGAAALGGGVCERSISTVACAAGDLGESIAALVVTADLTSQRRLKRYGT